MALRRAGSRGWTLGPPKCLWPGVFGVDGDELAELIDDGDGVEIALALGFAPGEEAVAAEHDAVAAGGFADDAAEHHAEFEAGALPGKPGELVAVLLVELVHLDFAVGGGGEGDAPVGVEMVDVGEGKIAVERGVDGGGDGIVAEGALGVEVDELVLVFDAAIDFFELEELVEAEGGEAGALDAAEVAAGAFDPEDLAGYAVEGVDLVELGAGVAAAEVGDAEVGTEEIGAVTEQFGGVELRRNCIVPLILKKAELGVRCHDGTSIVADWK